MFTRSIRWRFLLWLSFLLAAVLGALGTTAFRLYRAQVLAAIDSELSHIVSTLSSTVRQPPGGPRGGRIPGGPPPSPGRREQPPPGPMPGNLDERRLILTDELENLFYPAKNEGGLYFVVWAASGAVRSQAGPVPTGLTQPGRTGADTAIHLRAHDAFREAWHYTERSEAILVGRSITGDLAALRRYAWLLGGAAAVVLAVALGGGWLLVSGALKPVNEISATAARIAAGDLGGRIDVSETDSELGRLAGVLNDTFARLEGAFARQQQFTADAAHELRTPLAVLISEAQVTLARERTPEDYRHTIEVCLETAQQMRRLAESLLALARFDAGQDALRLTRFDLAERVRAGVELVQPLATEREITIRSELTSVETHADVDRIGQVIVNLLTNAVAYNKEHGEIHVATYAENGAAILAVTDSGPGIAPEDLPHVFERFYRADTSRARSEGRCGLGLAICKAAVEAHGGRITVSSQPGLGATFVVRLPVHGPG